MTKLRAGREWGRMFHLASAGIDVRLNRYLIDRKIGKECDNTPILRGVAAGGRTGVFGVSALGSVFQLLE